MMHFDADLFTSPFFIMKKLQRRSFRKYSGYISGNTLDAGSGAGSYAKSLKPGVTRLRMDILPDVKPDVRANCEAIPFQDNSFDTVICAEVLEHVKDPLLCLREMKRVLKGGGYMYITVPQCWGLHYEPEDYWRFTKYSVSYLLGSAGMDIIAIERLGGVFSMCAARLADVLYSLIKRILFFTPEVFSEKAAALLTFPFSAVFYSAALALDRIDKRDALGWAVLAGKRRV